jgi:SAM-dependent methyltransferase
MSSGTDGINAERDGTAPDLYAAYASQHVDVAASGRPWFPALDHVGVAAPLRLLDLGCGDGALLREAERRGLGEVAGVDHSPEQVARAHRAGSTSVVQDDAIAYLEATAGQWDVIVTVDLLEHLEHDDALRLAQAIAGALRPGGEWIAQVPNGVSPFVGNYAYGDFTHRTIYTDRSMQQIARAVGLEPHAVHAVTPPRGGLARTARRLVWSVVSGCFKLALAAETGRLRGHIVTQNLIAVARAPQTAGR